MSSPRWRVWRGPGCGASMRGAVRLLDATKVNLSGLSATWARFSADHCAAKLHVVYDPHGGVPLRAAVTPDKVNDITPAKAMPIEPGATYVLGGIWRIIVTTGGPSFTARAAASSPG